MEENPGFEERIASLERTVADLVSRMDSPASAPASRPQPRPHVASPKVVLNAPPARGADWWLARAGAALTVLALILLYQYAVGHGWITPVVRVFTGTAIGAALMYWGRKLEPAASDAASPVALRELMMGAALAAWYVSAYAASVLYHLVSIPAARFIYLALSVAGALIALNERRSLLAIVAIGTGFATPALLPAATGSIPAYTLFLAVLCGSSIYLYLMRGWQSVLWIAFFSMWGSIDAALGTLQGRNFISPGTIREPLFSTGRISLTLLVVAMTYAFLRAPVLRRKLLATGSHRYTEPIRSTAVKDFLKQAGQWCVLFSPNAGALDSFSLWVIMLAAPLVGISLLATAWSLGGYVWGALEIVAAAAAARRFLSGAAGDNEVADVLGGAAMIWSLAGFITIGRTFAEFAGSDANAISLGLVAVYSILAIMLLSPARFFTATAIGRSLAALAIAAVVFSELAALGDGGTRAQTGLSVAFGIAEVLAITAAFLAAREMSHRAVAAPGVVAFALAGYASFLLVDARVLGALWSPLVSATYAIAGTLLLIRGRSAGNNVMQRVGGATIAFVIGRLLFVDLVGVDTIWRVLLFLGCGALFLFTSHQMQSAAKQPPPDLV
jgi:Predicted membrane protein